MPITPAHAVAVLPIWKGTRGRLPIDGLVIGALVPDLPYFLHLHPVYAPGHSLMGLITYDLPLGILGLLTWRVFLRKPMIHLVKGPKVSLAGSRPSITSTFLVLVAIILGAFTHIVWDSTSHESGAVVMKLAALNEMYYGLPIYKWIQFGSGILGLAWLALLWLTNKNYWFSLSTPGQLRLIAFASPLILGPSISMAFVAQMRHSVGGVESNLVHLATGGIAGFCIGMAVFSTAYYIFFRSEHECGSA